jgi:hypothetical protein
MYFRVVSKMRGPTANNAMGRHNGKLPVTCNGLTIIPGSGLRTKKEIELPNFHELSSCIWQF